MEINFTIYGEPAGKERPRVTVIKGTNFAHAYTPAKTQNYEAKVVSCFVDQIKPDGAGVLFGTDDVFVNIWAYFPLLKADYTSTGKLSKKGQLKLNNKIKPTKKPDCDNIAKIILDALNGYAFVDDSQVVDLSVHKRYSECPRVEVQICHIN